MFTKSKSVGDRFLTSTRSIVKGDFLPVTMARPSFDHLFWNFVKHDVLLRPVSICLISSLRWCYNSCDTFETDWLIYGALCKGLQHLKSFHTDPDIWFCCRFLYVLNLSKLLEVFVFQLPDRVVYSLYGWMVPSEIGHHPPGKERQSTQIAHPEKRKST